MYKLNCTKMRLVLVGIFICSLFAPPSLWARPTTVQEVKDLVVGWLKADPKPLGTSLGQQVKQIETFTNQSDEPIYHIVYLEPVGLVIVSADDRVEPIIGFVQGNSFDPSPENPLGALVTEDLNRRIASVRNAFNLQNVDNLSSVPENQHKWRYFIKLANTPRDKGAIALMDASVTSVSEIRVAPLVKSKWGQLTVGDKIDGHVLVENCPLPCYNYYIPNNYPCGCPATALAQLIRWYEYPTNGIGINEFTITIGWPTGPAQQASTRGGDGLGGPYKWDLMPCLPDCNTPEVQRQAIGALCYDAGISMNQTYSKNASGWRGGSNERIINALKTTFIYANAVHGYNGESPIGAGLNGMVNPNLDAKKPVILGTVEHAFICDGYGYDNSTLYHHLNMGWLGLDNFWYDLTTSYRSPIDGYEPGWSLVCSCVYNVQTLPAGDGEIISGRVLDHNTEPIANVVLYATSDSETIAATETDNKGIYAFDSLESNTTYTINAMLNGYGFSSQEVTTGVSLDDSVVSGNLWGVDLVGLFCDFNSDQKVDIDDLVMLIEHWGQNDPGFDVAPAPSGDGIVDIQDLEVLLQYWGMEVEAPEFGLVAHWKLDETEGDIAYENVQGKDARLHGEPLWQPSGGLVDGALELDGIDDFMSADFVLNPADGDFSVFAWVKGGTPGQVVISQTDGANWLMADPSGGNLMTELKGAGRGAAPLLSQTVIADGNWHRIGFVRDGSNRILYVDDVEVARDTQTDLASSEGGLYFGATNTLEPDGFFSGLIDDIRLYDRAVTP